MSMPASGVLSKSALPSCQLARRLSQRSFVGEKFAAIAAQSQEMSRGRAATRSSVPDKRRLGFGNDVRLANEGDVSMDDWSEVTKDEERGNAHVDGATLSW